MPTLTEENISFLMNVLKHTQMAKPDWKAVAVEQGFSNANNTQQKFRKMIKDIGFEYVNDQIVDPNGDLKGAGDNNVATPTTTPRKRKPRIKMEKAAAGADSPSKKAKIDDSADGKGGNLATGSGSSKMAKVAKPEVSKPEAEVEAEIQD